ncbi:MAG: hypothetical protein AUJ57_07915 [Zetaproteobacteria bacterium CG1_02_53_45]|nr:MAG: hypothetical protein AUJ57_07915 [Zetaproteobacteria bacterium CG1_02_53_45]
MGIYNALFSGASGLTSFGEAVRVVGDNIANVNTIGFKSQNVTFTDTLSQIIGVSNTGSNQVGNGVKIGSITRDQMQGSIQTTASATDMAINGNGLFALRDAATNQMNYSRAGNFQLDKSFNLIDTGGNIVQGYKIDTLTGKAVGSATDLSFGNLAAQAKATTNVQSSLTLDSTTPVLPSGTVFDPNNPATFSFKSDTTIYDALGATHVVTQSFTRAGQDAAGNMVWDFHLSVDGGDLIGGTAGTPMEVGAPTASVVTPASPDNTSGAFAAGNGTIANAVVSNFQQAAVGATYSVSSNGAGGITVTSSSGATGTGVFAAAGTQAVTMSDGTIMTLTYGAVDVAGVGGSTAASTGGVAAPFISTLGTQTLVFGTAGELVQENAPAATYNWLGAAATTVDIDFGNAAGQAPSAGLPAGYAVATADAQGITGTGINGTVQMAGSFATRQATVDGYAAGFLDNLTADSSGTIFGTFTNGQRRALFQVALAKFPNDGVLNHVGGNLLRETIQSGAPVLERPGNGGMGTITPYGLEQSNVDLAAEFVKLIVVQRGYEANSKTILTTDQMLSSLMQLKR